jgi:hypothetical protein
MEDKRLEVSQKAKEAYDDPFIRDEILKLLFADRKNAEKQFGTLGGERLAKFKMIWEKYLEQYNSKTKTTLERGDQLESLVHYLLSNIPMFEVAKKVKSNTNEIDHLLHISQEGKEMQKNGTSFLKQEYMLCESKNYNFKKKIDVTWVGKFYSLMINNGINIGIIFSHNGFTGRNNWYAAKGLVRKLFLLHGKIDDLENSIYIIDFNKVHFERIIKGESFASIVRKEIEKIRFCCSKELNFETHSSIGKINIKTK